MQYKRSILDAIRKILRAIRESSRFCEAELGLSGAQLLVLQQLRSKKTMSVNELAEKTQTHQSSVSVVVRKLVQATLVERGTSAKDARRTEVKITKKGLKILQKEVPNFANEKLFLAIAALSEEKQMQLAILLTEVVDLAGFSSQPASLFLEDSQEEET